MMKQNDNEHIVFDMLEEVATESIAEVRNEVLFNVKTLCSLVTTSNNLITFVNKSKG